MPRVAASERGAAQTGVAAQPAGDVAPGLDARQGGGGSRLAFAHHVAAEDCWNGSPERVRAP
jgi:hypothetical protein